jgi:hypothetical protein
MLPVTAGPGRAAHAVFERGQLLDADRPARMHLAGGDADLGAHAELAAIGELRRGIVQQDGRIDLVEEALDGLGILGDDRFGVVRGKGLDMLDRAPIPSTSFTAMMASRYSVAQSSSVAGLASRRPFKDVLRRRGFRSRALAQPASSRA